MKKYPITLTKKNKNSAKTGGWMTTMMMTVTTLKMVQGQ
jgi:hypothetical protein